MKNQFYRHGDILLKRVAKAPEGEVRVANRYVVAEGEATGHCHTLESPASISVTEVGGVKFIYLDAPATLSHQEHATIAIEPGVYEVIHEVEDSLFDEDEMRRVID